MSAAQSGGARAAVYNAALTGQVRQCLCARFDAVDAMDIERFLDVHTDDGILLFGTRLPMRGKQEISTQVQQFWQAIAGVRHDVIRVRAVEAIVFVESVVTYTRLDGRLVAVACCDVFEFEGARIRETRAYLDQSEVLRP